MTRMSSEPGKTEPTEFHLSPVNIGPDQLELMRKLRDAAEQILSIIENEVEPIAPQIVPMMQFPELMRAGDIVTEVIWPESGWSVICDLWYSIAGHADAVTGHANSMWSPAWYERRIRLPEMQARLDSADDERERDWIAGSIENKLRWLDAELS